MQTNDKFGEQFWTIYWITTVSHYKRQMNLDKKKN